MSEQEYINKTLLIGMTYLKHDGTFIEQKQYFGTIVKINKQEGIVVKLDNNNEFKLPPDFRSFKKANPGEYTEKSTGKVIIDPDYLTTWTITKPDPNKKAL